MAFPENNISEGMMWADTDSDCGRTLEYSAPESDCGEWETVGRPKLVRTFAVRPAKWCRDGNACQWQNCKFRHERCAHYDNWIRRGKTGNTCRCQSTDPESNKRPDEGGCMYDHRDPANLKMFLEVLPACTEAEIWDNFMPLGLEGHCANIFDVSDMGRMDRALLIRSLTAAKVEFEDCGDYMYIYAAV